MFLKQLPITPYQGKMENACKKTVTLAVGMKCDFKCFIIFQDANMAFINFNSLNSNFQI